MFWYSKKPEFSVKKRGRGHTVSNNNHVPLPRIHTSTTSLIQLIPIPQLGSTEILTSRISALSHRLLIKYNYPATHPSIQQVVIKRCTYTLSKVQILLSDSVFLPLSFRPSHLLIVSQESSDCRFHLKNSWDLTRSSQTKKAIVVQ